MNHYKSIFISDVHLGTRDCKAKELKNFLKYNHCDNLFLVGDIIDGWKMQQNKLRWKQSHTDVIKKFLSLAKKGTNVIYITGNHDEFLRPMVNMGISFGKISIHNQYEYHAMDGNTYLITHGDLFDGITRLAPWLAFIGDKAYDLILSLNSKYNWIRHKLGFGYWSLSKYLKHTVKKATNFMFQFEDNITNYAKKRNYSGTICGHIHHPEIKIINNIQYMNTGDWVESMSALVEHHNGQWEIIHWATIQNENTI